MRAVRSAPKARRPVSAPNTGMPLPSAGRRITLRNSARRWRPMPATRARQASSIAAAKASSPPRPASMGRTRRSWGIGRRWTT